MTTVLALAMAACVALMVSEQLRQHRRRQAEHARLLDGVEAMLEHPVPGRDEAGLPVLTGSHCGQEVRVDLLADALALRKLPRLLLRGAVHRELAVTAPVFVQRPTLGSGMLEGDRRLERGLPLPAGWPADLIVRTTADGPRAVGRSLAPLGALFDDPRVASVLVAPRGLRLTWEVARGDQAAWRVSRGARFREPVPAGTADELLTAAGEVAASLGAVPGRGARGRSAIGSSRSGRS